MSPLHPHTPIDSLPPTGQPPLHEPTVQERVGRVWGLVRRGLRYWKVSFAILAVGVTLSFFVAWKVRLMYRSECRMLFRPATRMGARVDEEGPSERAKRIGERGSELLRTSSRLEHIIHEFQLFSKTVESRGMHEAVEEMRTHVGSRVGGGDTFVISFEYDSPEMAQRVTQRLAETMLQDATQGTVGDAKRNLELAEQEAQKAETELEDANRALATFLTLHPEFAAEAQKAAVGGAGRDLPILPKIGSVDSSDAELASLYAQRARIEAQMRPAGTPPADPNEDPRVKHQQGVREEAARAAAAAQADLTDKKTRMTDEHPDVRAAKLAYDSALRQLQQADAALNQALQQARSQATKDTPVGPSPELEHKLEQVQAQIAKRQQQLRERSAEHKADAGTAPVVTAAMNVVELQQEWDRLFRTVKLAKDHYNDRKGDLERARLSSNVAASSGGDQLAIIDAAYLPGRPSQGGRTKTMGLGLIVTLVLAFGYAAARVLFDDTLRDGHDIEALKLVPVLGVLPKITPPKPETSLATGGQTRGA